MDSTKKISLVTVDDEEEENIKDNGQLIHDIGYKEDTDENGPKSLIMEIYPWIPQFKKICRTSLIQRSMESLKNLMKFYSRHIRPSVNECHTKPLRADKLKDSISETLLFFLYYYREIGKDQDRVSYMDHMSDLLAMYIDMELKASKKGNEHHSKISARLSSCLHVYLEHSAEHMLDTLLKVHFMTCNYHEILDPVITKIFKGIQEHPNSSIMYVRYLLAYRLWKKLNKDVAVRNQINVTALSSLGPVPAEFHPFVVEYVLPKVPKTQKLTTKLLLLHKFEVEKSCEEFLNFCKKERGLDGPTGKEGTSLTDTVTSAVPEDNDSLDLIVHDNLENITTQPEVSSSSANLLIHKSLNNESDTNSKRPSVTKSANAAKLSSLRKAKKSNDIVFIDLTSDSVTEKVIRQKKTRRKLSWLGEAKKRVNAKTTEKKNSAVQDEAASAKQLEDIVDLHSLRIESSGSPNQDMDISGVEEITVENEDTTTEERILPQPSVVIEDATTTERTVFEIPNTLDNANEHYDDRIEEATVENEKTSTEEMSPEECEKEIVSSVSKVSAMEKETASIPAHNCGSDECLNENKIDDERYTIFAPKESHSLEAGRVLEKDKILVAYPVSVPIAIKAEHVNDEPYKIINEDIVSNAVELPVAEYASEVSLQTSCAEQTVEATACESKIREVEFQDNIDGLSLLASVSQRVSLLTTAPVAKSSNPINGELIKVKNYASLANLDAVEEPDTSTPCLDALPFCGNPAAEVINRIVGIYPEDAMDKVAFEVEVTSTGEIESYEGCDQVNGVVPFLSNNDEACCNSRIQGTNVVSIPESTTQSEKDDTNVILNGETVVLFQKSPNSNLYIINKAVENRDHVNDEVPNGLRELNEHTGEAGAFPYELYDNVYCGQPPPYDLTQYNRELSTQETRRNKKVIVDSVAEANKGSDPLELTKPGKKKTLSLDVIGKGSPGKRKSSGNSSISRRHRIKQEYNGCSSNLPGYINPNYGIPECSQEHVESTRSIHMPVAHANPLSSIYTKYPTGAELYLPCHKNCNSMTCGLPVNSATSLHSHPCKTSGKSHCSCLNCTYGIVPHCSECILPSGETRASSIENTSYYLPIHSTVQTSAVQDCSRTSGDEPLVKIFDEQLVCKLEQTILDSKPLSNVGVKCEPDPIYRAELDNKLPLKKRFKAMMSVSFEEMSIKREKVQSYPGTPMLSIAALEAQDSRRSSDSSSDGSKNSLDLSPKCRGETHGSLHHAREMIRRDYRKEMMMSPPSSQPQTLNGSVERKRKRRSVPNPLSGNVDVARNEASYQKICKTPVKHKQTTATAGMVTKRLTTPTKSQARPSEKVKELDGAPLKNSTRQTRSSKRNVPKVNYIYADGDSDWNPSGGGAKRKRKKTTR